MQNKQTLIPFFDGVTSLAQILIFFLIGLLAYPHQMPEVILPAFAIVVFLTLIARPVAVFFAASAVSLQHPPMPVNFMGRSARRFFVGVCNYGGCKRH